MKEFSDEKLMEFLADLDPARSLPDEYPFRAGQFSETDWNKHAGLATSRSWPSRRRGLLVASIGVASVLLASLWLANEGGDGGASSPAAAALIAAGGVAKAQAAAPDDSISYASYLTGNISGTVVEKPFNLMLRDRTEVWRRSDGSGRLRTEQLKPEWPSDRDRRRWVEFGAPDWPEFDWGAVKNRVYGSGGLEGFTHEGGLIDGGLPPSRELPTDAEALRELIFTTAEKNPNKTDPRAFALASAILVQPGASPDLKAAAYEVLAGIPGIELIEDAEDPIGRTGTGIAMVDQYGERTTLIFDPGSAQPFAQVDEVTAAPNRFYESPIVGYTLVEETGQVADLHSRP